MNPENNEPRHVAGAGGRGSDAVVAEPIVPQPTEVPRGPQSTGRMLGAIRRLIIRAYWATAKARYQRGDYVDYGSPDWCALDIDDPRKMAGMVAFAELWRRYNPEIAEDFNRQLAHPEPLWQRATTEACDLAFRQIRAKHERSRKEAA